jgi:membrane carboxypeptidase/penicillin-binding protein PbpC
VGGVVKVAAVLAVLVGVWIWLTLPDVKPLRLKRPPVEEWVDYGDLPKKLQRAIVANNDPDFFRRHAVSFASIAAADRALCVPSPLTRRVAHALYPTPSWNPVGPLRDLVIAAQLEKQVSRGRILDLYVNTAAQFGDVTGVGPAAKQYVHKSADDLSDHDATELVSKLR